MLLWKKYWKKILYAWAILGYQTVHIIPSLAFLGWAQFPVLNFEHFRQSSS